MKVKMKFEKSDLISFGAYLLSKERENAIAAKNEGSESDFEREYYQVNDFDFNTWMHDYLSNLF